MENLTKKNLRLKIKQERRLLNKNLKNQLDNNVYENIIKYINLKRYNLILSYISTEIEVSTRKIIEFCLENNIDVAFPRCAQHRKIDFFYYEQNSIFEKSEYGIFEPVLDKNKPVVNFDKTLCMVPGLSFDKNGYRLGYGGGYYDRFICDHPNIVTIGICYHKNMTDCLPIGIYDKCVNYVITDKTMEVCNE